MTDYALKLIGRPVPKLTPAPTTKGPRKFPERENLAAGALRALVLDCFDPVTPHTFRWPLQRHPELSEESVRVTCRKLYQAGKLKRAGKEKVKNTKAWLYVLPKGAGWPRCRACGLLLDNAGDRETRYCPGCAVNFKWACPRCGEPARFEAALCPACSVGGTERT